jgi:hypothetical protein
VSLRKLSSFQTFTFSLRSVPVSLPLATVRAKNNAGGTLRGAGAAVTTEQSQWTAKSAGSDELTFDTKDEIIISSGSQFCPQS